MAIRSLKVVSSKHRGLVHTLKSPDAMDGFSCLFASVSLTQAENIQEDGIPFEELPLPDLPVGKTVGTFSWMTVETGRSSSLLQCLLQAGGAGCCEKSDWANHTGKPETSTPPWSLHSSCLQDSTLSSCHDFSQDGLYPIRQTKQSLSIICWLLIVVFI